MASIARNTITVTLDTLPSGPTVVFQHSSFFLHNGPDAILPSPHQVLAKKADQDPSFNDRVNHPPVFFESLRLIVEFGKEPKVTIAEGQCLWALRRHLPEVPVPEIYGWVQEDGQVFVYMELVQGITLEKRWDSLCRSERIGVCEQLKSMMDKVRQLQQDLNDQFLGHVNRDPYNDIVFTNGILPRAGPFSQSVREFHDWLSAMIKKGKGERWPGYTEEEIPDPYRRLLPDDSTVALTHSDIHPSNIMVTEESSPCRVVALIDCQ
ncbi:hypothetical protein NW762_013606 [Fusarium torreyae]|uniref:Aminoglycoside phosphotransferase domain-containing protein n=1 Tax=Fusarium torreyae TaxID=1237075 RepID=A0A9W8RLJ1_9HYPO|nr:hypothetical protein NW762_013606 [Fusarium torreyae]